MDRAATRVLLACVRVYQATFSSLMPMSCKFYPTCSHYAAQALARHGAWRGIRLAAWRLARCGPFTRGGYDPVPELTPELQPEITFYAAPSSAPEHNFMREESR